MGSLVSSIAGPVIGGALSFLGGRQQSQATQQAANTQAQAAQAAAAQAAFRPVGITSRFGTSQFGFSGDNLTSASYTASPEIQALQNRLSELYGSSLGLAETAPAVSQGLFNLGQQYFAATPEAARQQYIQQQTALLDPIRQREEQRLASSVFGRGRAGLSVGDQGQPELAALASARRQQDLALAAAAENAAQQRITFGTGLLGTGLQLPGQALAPFQAQFGTSQLLEEAARAPLDIGAQLGGRSAQAGAQAGQALLTGGLAAAQTRLAGQTQSIASGQDLLQSFFRNLNFGGGTSQPFGGTPQNPWYG